MEGHVFNIQRFSLHDGPGIRTVVFMKGCNMRCQWCHNPEAFTAASQLQYDSSLCIGCGKCISVCKNGAHGFNNSLKIYDRSKCTNCGTCAEYCFTEALMVIGRTISCSSVIEEVMKDFDYYVQSGGGVTFSGGEPLLQKDFLKALLIECKSKGLHTAIETALNAGFETLDGLIDHTDLFIVDIKCIDNSIHKKTTGADNKIILDNIKRLSASANELWIRIPVIPGVNTTIHHMAEILAFIKTLNKVNIVELMPFHNMGSKKYKNLGMNYSFQNMRPPDEDFINKIIDLFSAEGIACRNGHK